jgi:hypothetical protein
MLCKKTETAKLSMLKCTVLNVTPLNGTKDYINSVEKNQPLNCKKLLTSNS